MNWWTFRNTILWYHFVLLYHVFIRNIRIFEAVDFVFKEHLSCTVAVCRYIFERLSSTCVTKRYTAVLFCDTIYVYIIRRWTCFSHVVCTIGFYMMSIIFIERALLELDISCASVLYFYVMSWHSPTTCSPGTLYLCMSCRVFLYDVSCICIIRAVQELDILCPTVLYISTWCHWY